MKRKRIKMIFYIVFSYIVLAFLSDIIDFMVISAKQNTPIKIINNKAWIGCQKLNLKNNRPEILKKDSWLFGSYNTSVGGDYLLIKSEELQLGEKASINYARFDFFPFYFVKKVLILEKDTKKNEIIYYFYSRE